jgi:hypothetical protein
MEYLRRTALWGTQWGQLDDPRGPLLTERRLDGRMVAAAPFLPVKLLLSLSGDLADRGLFGGYDRR